MRKLRVLVLVHETLVPPESTQGFTDQEIDEWRTEYDVTTCLKAMGHDVRVLGLGDNLAGLYSYAVIATVLAVVVLSWLGRLSARIGGEAAFDETAASLMID